MNKVKRCRDCPSTDLVSKSFCQRCLDRRNKNQREKYERNRTLGLCLCGRERREGGVLCDGCYENAKRRRLRMILSDKCAICGKQPPEIGKKECKACRDRESVGHKRRSEEVMSIVFGRYGMKCSCPGGCPVTEPKFLTIDHEKSDGSEHRKKEKIGKGQSLYRWLIKKNFPKGFRTLCWNCNSGRARNGGICPHERR